MGRPRRLVILLGAVAAATAVAAVVRHGRGAARGREEQGSILIGDVASMPFPGGSFDLVVSTMSMHHWADPVAGLTEMARVLRPGARALVWDFRPGFVPFPRSYTRSGRAHPEHSASRGERDAVALALEVQPDAENRAGTRR